MKVKNKKKNYWILKITIATFLISVCFTLISELAIPNVSTIFGVFLIFIFVFIGVIFDMIGVSVTASDEAMFHSLASKKTKGAKTAIKLKKNAEKVASFCQDVIGDICGIISGSTSAVIVLKIAEHTNNNDLIITLIVMGIVSSFTIGGKALVKGIAMKKADKILYRFSKIISLFVKE